MKTHTVGIALSIALLALSITGASAQSSKEQFCQMWHGICNDTGNASVCKSRLSGCRASGCYHFNNPGPRCWNNTADRNAPALQRARGTNR